VTLPRSFGANQIGWPLLSTISGPLCRPGRGLAPNTFFGAMKISPSAVPAARLRTSISGGRRSGRER
jgi:hypothetical protein